MIRLFLTRSALVTCVGELRLVTSLCLQGSPSSWWLGDTKLGSAVVGVA